ncbi:tetratricopeptide repeat protein [Pontiella sp. NLcol2]|uniref:Tetratricopeptide repeat protein n=1 Tax=Pontiella agarivorans TaxID=3038953 RepID=A0ABU5MZX3_9BACT|nr:tetratricopeptide repeat protein [Pontiella agarivorans]
MFVVFKAVAQEPVPKPQSSRYPNIRASLDDGFFVLAEQQARGVVLLEPKEEEAIEANLLLAHALWGQKRYSELLRELQDLSGDPGFVYWRARAHFELRQYTQALDILNASEEELGNSRYAPSVLRLKGFLQKKIGLLDEAEATYKKFAADFPNNRFQTENRFDIAEVYTLQQRIPEAIAIYEGLSESVRENTAERARLKLAHLLYTQGADENFDRARGLLNGLATNENTRLIYRIDAWVDLAALEQKAGDIEATEAAMRAGIALSPDARQRVPLKLALARVLLDEEKTDPALKLLEECRAEAPDQEIAAELQLEKANALFQAQRYQAAEEAYQVYLDVAVDEAGLAEAYYGKGLCLWKLARYAEAASVFDKAYKALKDPELKANVLFKAADSYFQADRLEDAEKRYRSFVTDFPVHEKMPNALYQLGLSLMRIGRRDEALTTFGILESNHAESPFAEQAALRSADVLRANREWDASLEKYDQIIGTYTNASTAATCRFMQGLVLYEYLKQYPEAQKAFEEVIEKYPDSEYVEQAEFMRGFSMALQGFYEESIDACMGFVERYPESEWSPKVIFWLGEQFYNQGRYEEAEPLFLRIARDFKGHEYAARALYWAGRAAAAQSNYVNAIERYSEVAKTYPDSDVMPQVRFAQGDALTELGQFARAILAFEEIIKNYPDSYLVNSAWGRKGDCQFSLGVDNPARYVEAMSSYQAILDRPSAPVGLKLHVENKIGECLEKTNVSDKAFSRYMNVVYTFINENVERSPYTVTWFTRSARSAGAIKERQRAWKEAVQVYERLLEANVNESASQWAKERITKIKQENWLLFQEQEERE